MLIDAAHEREFNTFGLRYCTGIYHERKEAIVIYLSERQKEEWVESFVETDQRRMLSGNHKCSA